MLKLTLKDWAGLEVETIEIEDSYANDMDRLKKTIQNMAMAKTGVVIVENNGEIIAQASYLNGAI